MDAQKQVGSVEHPSRSLGAWIPFLWNRVLFSGPHRETVEPYRLSALLILLILPSLLLYPSLGFHLFEPDESRYAQIPREMLQRSEIVVPYLQQEPYLDKPPLLYWSIMASYSVFGVHDWAARLVPALALHGAVLVIYLLGRRSLGERPAFFGAVLLSLTPGFIGMGRILLLDGLLTFFTTLALLSAFEAVRGEHLRWGWWLLASVACALGILTKGPIALVLVAPPIWFYRRLVGNACTLSYRALASFLGVVVALNLPWYVAITLRIPEFPRYFFWEHHVLRYTTDFAHQRGFFFYLPVVLLGMIPGTFFLWSFGRFLLTGEETTAKRRTPEFGFLLLAGGWCIGFFTLSSCKLPTYVMPAFPLLALALGYFYVHSNWRTSRWPTAWAASMFVVIALAHHAIVPWYAWYRSPMGRPELVERFVADRSARVVCYPRACDSVAFYLGRDDMPNYRSKEIETLRGIVREQPRTVILCTHRHSLEGLRQLLPPEVHVTDSVHLGLTDIPGVPPDMMKPLAKLMGSTALGLCDVAVVEWRSHSATRAER